MKANRTNMLKRTAAAVLCAAFLLPRARLNSGCAPCAIPLNRDSTTSETLATTPYAATPVFPERPRNR